MLEPSRESVYYRRWLRLITFATCILCVVVLNVLLRESVMNRFTDSWWHVAVADEFARTGVFAKDPFIQEAPPFAQFGAMDLLTGWISSVIGVPAVSIWPSVVTAASVVFFMAFCVAGGFAAKHLIAGLICVVAGFAFVVPEGYGIIQTGLPFTVGISLWNLILVLLLERWPWQGMPLRAVWLGILAGVCFVIHVFVGAVALAAVMIACVMESFHKCSQERQTVANRVLWFAVVFTAISFRWWTHQLNLIPILQITNAHLLPNMQTSSRCLMHVFVATLLCAAILWVYRKNGEERRRWSVFSAIGVVLLVFCVPVVNVFVATKTSTFMAERWPLFFPSGVVAAYLWRQMCENVSNVTQRVVVVICVAGVLAAIAFPVVSNARVHVYLLRTHDYDVHPYAYLQNMGEVLGTASVLSDPWTSYFVRGMTGRYVVTVPSGHASPAVDYVSRDVEVRRLLRQGPNVATVPVVGTFGSVLVDKVNGRTAQFAGVTEEHIVATWTNAGWCILHEDGNCIVLTRCSDVRKQER